LREQPVLQVAVVIERHHGRGIRGAKLCIEICRVPWLQVRAFLQVVEVSDDQDGNGAERAVDDEERDMFEQCFHAKDLDRIVAEHHARRATSP
jgi:hypothetical protein